jgi:hypothetical protein
MSDIEKAYGGLVPATLLINNTTLIVGLPLLVHSLRQEGVPLILLFVGSFVVFVILH